MTLYQLRIFAAVAKCQNVTKASQELHVSQPCVSHQLKLLEEECKVKLYRKTGRGIELTEEGRLLLGEAEPILSQVEKVKEKFSGNSNNKGAGSLTVGGSHSQSVHFLPLLLSVFKEAHPQVEVTLRTAPSLLLEQMVTHSEIELALLHSSSHIPSLVYEPYGKERLLTCASTRHPLAKKEKLTLEELLAAPLIVKGNEGKRTWVEDTLRQCEKKGMKLNIVMRCESPVAVKTAVKAGIGVGLLYQGDALSPDVGAKNGELRIINVPELKLCADVFIAYSKDRPLSIPAQRFLTLLREWPHSKIKWLKGALGVTRHATSPYTPFR